MRVKNDIKSIKLLYNSWEVVIKLINDCSSIVSDAKYKTIHKRRISSILAGVAKISDHSNLKTIRFK